ncbi:TRAP transporter substrate-binding protein [Alkalihalobacterium chitinilyticum]|uniref:TRAP transporter substrate-binding protein n=1 Tax=Alkalihalobacterium chitinilyticum TaxID=2980103 RepID=A0ABT5VLM6_9BACI|nr:TRAP transporter substrate-binding protein [Alkalihalobacterium chitinilyticum]MDE5415169.1 TRAP transporter substrate-binding protein [Alkalihalobacterium chitinilyticum]
MKRWPFLTAAVLATTMLLGACGGSQTSTEGETGGDTEEPAVSTGESFVLQAGHSLPEDHPYELGLQEMAKNIEERTNGQVVIETFPNSQIGAERELTEALTLGTVDLVVTSTAPVSNFVPELEVLDLPFLFNDRDAAVAVLEGEIGQEIFASFEQYGIVPLSWGENGFRHVTNGLRPITEPADLKGLSIRTQENPVHRAAFEALGAQPSPMAWTEALTALQQKVVDAQENPAIVADQFNLFEANQKYMTLTGHVYSAALFLLSQETYDKLPEDLRAIVVEEGQKAGEFQRNLIIEMEQESLQNLKEQGMEIIEDVDVDPFREGIVSVYENFSNQDLLQRILDAQ